MSNRLVCTECGWRGDDEAALTAPNPFEPEYGYLIQGCPKCKAVNTLRTTCDEPCCWEPDTIGMPVEGGYRRTCYVHAPPETWHSQKHE